MNITKNYKCRTTNRTPYGIRTMQPIIMTTSEVLQSISALALLLLSCALLLTL